MKKITKQLRNTLKVTKEKEVRKMKLQNTTNKSTLNRQIGIAFFAVAMFIFGTANIVSGQTSPGDLDLTFNGTGMVTTDFGAGNETGRDLEIQADGKIVMIGTASNGTNNDFAVLRYNTNGSLDTSFGNGGRVTTPIGTSDDTPIALAIQSDGKLVVLGIYRVTSFNQVALVRYNTDGSLDTSFGGGNGIAIDNFGINVTDIKIQSDGKFLVSATRDNSGNNTLVFVLTRYNSNGTKDTAFGNNGRVDIPFGNNQTDAGASSLAIQTDGKIVLAGGFSSGNTTSFALARLNPDGSLDTSFDGDGLVTTSAASGSAQSVAIQPDGKIVVAGFASTGNNDFALARYNTNGSLDTSFDTDGVVITSIIDRDQALSVTIASDGKIIAGGVTTNTFANAGNFALAVYNPDGSLDTTFSGDGKLVIDFGGNDTASSVKTDSSGRIVIGGTGNNMFAAARVLLGQSTPPMNVRTRFDFDGDRRADLSVFRPSTGTWFIRAPNGTANQFPFGNASDEPIAADYDGDGRTDIAVRSSDPAAAGKTVFSISLSSGGFISQRFGIVGDNASVIGDWDGDGADDYAVYRDGSLMGGQSFFFYYPSSNTTGDPITDFISIPWGAPGDLPMHGDFDGDGRQDPAVFRPSNNVWYILQSSNGQLRADYWGLSTDKFVPADYDGDGKTDLAVFRDGIWYILQSSNSQPRYEIFGFATDRLVPADYDGDGKTDVAVFRDGIWYLQQSTNGFAGFAFGSATDRPVPERF